MITGNEGKTLTRELIADVLRTKYSVLDTDDSYHVDVSPWQDVHPNHDYCLTELRDDCPMGKGRVAATLNPDICVITGMTEALDEIVASVKDGGMLLVNRNDSALIGALQQLDTSKLNVETFGSELCADNLPFADMRACSSAAYVLGVKLGLDEAAVRGAVCAYELNDYTHNVVSVEGVDLVLDINCKTGKTAEAAVDVMASMKGRKIAVLGQIDDGTDIGVIAQKAADAGAEYIFCNVKACVGRGISVKGAKVTAVVDERALELAMLDVLADGDVVLMCGSREAGLCTAVRRLFGLTDGFMINCEYWTSPSVVKY